MPDRGRSSRLPHLTSVPALGPSKSKPVVEFLSQLSAYDTPCPAQWQSQSPAFSPYGRSRARMLVRSRPMSFGFRRYRRTASGCWASRSRDEQSAGEPVAQIRHRGSGWRSRPPAPDRPARHCPGRKIRDPTAAPPDRSPREPPTGSPRWTRICSNSTRAAGRHPDRPPAGAVIHQTQHPFAAGDQPRAISGRSASVAT